MDVVGADVVGALEGDKIRDVNFEVHSKHKELGQRATRAHGAIHGGGHSWRTQAKEARSLRDGRETTLCDTVDGVVEVIAQSTHAVDDIIESAGQRQLETKDLDHRLAVHESRAASGNATESMDTAQRKPQRNLNGACRLS